MLPDLQHRLITVIQSVSPVRGQCNVHIKADVSDHFFLSVYYDAVYTTVFGCLIHVYILHH